MGLVLRLLQVRKIIHNYMHSTDPKFVISMLTSLYNVGWPSLPVPSPAKPWSSRPPIRGVTWDRTISILLSLVVESACSMAVRSNGVRLIWVISTGDSPIVRNVRLYQRSGKEAVIGALIGSKMQITLRSNLRRLAVPKRWLIGQVAVAGAKFQRPIAPARYHSSESSSCSNIEWDSK